MSSGQPSSEPTVMTYDSYNDLFYPKELPLSTKTLALKDCHLPKHQSSGSVLIQHEQS